jgi:phasin family protein
MATTKSPISELDKTLEPVRALNKLALDNAAKVIEMNFDVARRYADLTLSSMREVFELKDPAAVQAYVAKQPEAMKAFAESARADAEAAVKLGMSYFEEAGKLVAASTKKAA